MNLEDIRAELEEDMLWRQEEINYLYNQLQNEHKEKRKDILRRALVVMLYAHYEGFCKNALVIYAKEINSRGIKRADAIPQIVTSCMGGVFKKYFGREKNFDSQLTFIKDFDNLWKETVNIPVDSVVDTKSNLLPDTLKDLLKRLGFSGDVFSDNDGLISALVNRRHSVAHVERIKGLDDKNFEQLKINTFRVMADLTQLIVKGLKDSLYLKTGSR